MNSYKIVVVGDSRVGKTSFISMLKYGNYDKKYIATIGVEIKQIKFKNINMCFDFWDCAGNYNFGGLREGYYIGADAYILMFDLTNIDSYKKLSAIYRDIIRVSGKDFPIILCGNKSDEKKIFKKRIDFHRRKSNMTYYVISCKNNHNLSLVIDRIRQKIVDFKQKMTE